MASKDELMLLSKDTLAERLANRTHNGGGGSVYNPFKADGVKVTTLGQELGILGMATEDSGDGRPWAWIVNHGAVDKGVIAFVKNIDPRRSFSGKVVVGSTALSALGKFLGRRGRPIKLGLLKLN